MSTLSILTPRVSPESDVDTRFDALVRLAVPAQRDGSTHVEFDRVFDLDYGQPESPAADVREPRSTRVRAVPVETRPAPPRTVRLTHRGRVVLVLAFLGLALALMIPMGGWATATLTGGSPEPVRIVVVQPGDTLYGLAGDLAKPGHVREMVHRIQELNSLPGGQITEGQKLAVPRG
jgi:hypothetical protein